MFQFDDHEIYNNADDHEAPAFHDALQQYDRFLGKRNPQTNDRYYSWWHADVVAFSFSFSCVLFFFTWASVERWADE
jgi:hypothetical protein